MSIKKDIFAPWSKGLGATRRAAMLLLVMMLTATTAWAQTTITPTTPSQDGDGYYLIGNVAELYGFAELVNNGNETANAKLTADIVVNENVLDANGEANTGEFVQWTPIGNVVKGYSGTFDGQGHTISGLYVSGDSWRVGLIGTVSGSAVVKNLGIVDSYFNSSGNFLGSIVGYVDRQSSVTLANVYSTSTVKGVNFIGGLVNGSFGSVTIINSYFAGKTSAGCSYGDHHDDLVSGDFIGSDSGTLNIVNTFVVGTSLYGTTVTAEQLSDGTVAAALHYYQDALADGSMFGLSGGKTNFSGTIDGVGIPTANITLHTFTGDTKTYSSKYVVGNTTPLPVNVACEGYNKFAGWYNNANLVGDAVTSISSSETGDKEYWAKYKQSHTVTFELDGGLIEGAEIDHYIEGEVTPLPALVFKGGASFEGWYTTSDCSGERYVAIPATATEDMTFYAKWGAEKTTFYLMQMGEPEPASLLYEGENIVWLDKTTEPRYRISNNEHKYWGSGDYKDVPYDGGEYAFSNSGNNFIVQQSGFYVFTLTDRGGEYWFVSVLKLKSMLNCDVASIPTQVYTGSAIEPDVTVKDGKTPLYPEDYEVTYSNNVNVGTATVTITGKGDYSGETAATFTIIPKAVTNDGITIAAIADQTYTGSAIEPAVTVTDGEKTLTLGTDYTIGYSANVNVGTATATITGKGNYSGEKAATFTIAPKLVTNNGITVTIPSQTWTGNELTPVIIVKDGETTLTLNEDYTVTAPSGPIQDAGNYTYTINGMGNYAGSKEATFTILPSTVIVNVTGNGTVTYNDKVATNGEVIGVVADKGTDVTLTLAPESGYAVSIEYGYTRYTNSSEMTINGAKLPINGTTATLTVPNDLKDGTYVNLTVTFVSALAGGADEVSAVALTDNTLTDLAGGWYKVDSDITFDHTLNLLGDTHLIIDDGKTMTVNTASNRGIYSDYTLFVSGEGTLSVATTGDSGIAVCVGNYVQTGATVTASGYIGIRCTDDFIAFNFDNDFTFSGGQLTATGNSRGIRADNNITLSCTNATDFIQASSYRSVYGAVKIADGKALTDGTEASNGMNGYSGTLTNEQITAIGGKTLHRAVTTSYVDASGTLHENVIAIPLDNTMTTLAAGWYVVNSDVAYTGTVTLSGDVTLILGDGCTMSFGKEGELLNATIMECNFNHLTIYGQSGGTGWLKAYSAQYDAIHNVYYTQYSGNVLIFDGNGACIYAREFTILGGTLDLKDVGGANGEIVTTENINIRGGKLWAWYTGLKTNGKIILDYTNATDQIRAYSYQPQNGLEIADGKTLVDENGTIWSGTLEVVYQIGFNNSTLKPVMGVTLTKEGNNVSATFSGSSETTLSIPVDVNVTSVTYNRAFTMDKPSTVMLPFNKAVSEIGGGTFYTFGGVEKKNNKWEATMNEVTGSLTANTPYLFVPTGTSLTFTGGATLNTTGGGNCETADEGSHWTFKGTYEYMKWTDDSNDPDYNADREAEIGRAYGFAGVAKTDIEVGDFVKVANGAKIRPMCCYLLWNNEPNSANARSFTRGAAATDEELPQRITVRLVGSNGETTAIGTLDTKTGEMTFDSEAWYTLDGVRLSGKPSTKGIYINNGKKVVIK